MEIAKSSLVSKKMLCEKSFFFKETANTAEKKLSSIQARFQTNNFPHFEAQAFE